MEASVPVLPGSGIAAVPSSIRRLPNGSCNFRQLDTGIQGPVCGCQSFWLDHEPTESRVLSDHARAWCICACGHHACFHQPGYDQGLHSFTSGAVLSGIPSLPRQRRFDETKNHSQSGLHIQQSCIGRDHVQEAAALPSTAPPSEGPHSEASRHVIWTKRQPSPLESRISLPNLMEYAHVPEDLVASATEVNTPSFHGSPRASQTRVSRCSSVPLQVNVGPKSSQSAEQSTHEAQQGDVSQPQNESTGALQDVLASGTRIEVTSELKNIIQSYARRLDVLENSSFSHVPADEMHEKLELVEGRLLDLESWRSDVEAEAQARTDTDDYSQSDNYVMSGASQQLTDVEERLGLLEGAYPSYAYPWEIDVVLLPWGSKLKGIWVTPPETRPSDVSVIDRILQEWHHLASPITESTAADLQMDVGLPASWMAPWPVVDPRRLMPKAPGPKSAVFQRLKSRGLVRRVTITECGASHIWNTIFNTFYLFLVQNAVYGNPLSSTPPEYPGLAQPLVPLRKVRGSPHLQFLSPHEMITPAAWDFDFLKSGVLMKTKGMHRLYITTSESYVQSDSGQWSWSWLRICGLPRAQYSPDDAQDESSQGVCVETTRDEEECWDHHPTLDHLPSFERSSSFSSHGDHGCRARSRSPPGYKSEHAMAASSSPTGSVASIPFMSSCKRIRSTPTPVSSDRCAKLSSSKRCIEPPSEDALWYQKRRRISTSPGIDQRTTCLTPRRSREPRSPSFSDGWADMESPLQHTSGNGIDGGPQFAYATPHSNTAAALYPAAGGDTEPDSESSSDEGSSASGSEKEWEGVADDEQDSRPCTRAKSPPVSARDWEEHDTDMANDDDDDDHSSSSSGASVMFFGSGGREERDEDLDDGLTIYEAHL